MNKLQSKLLAGTFAISSIFAAQAQTSANDDKLIAMNTTEVGTSASAELVGEKKNAGPTIRQGDFVDAWEFSLDHKALAISISGGELNEKYTAAQYAKMLETMFKDTERVDMPTQAYFFINESGDNRSTVAGVIINGKRQDMNGGQFDDSADTMIHPYDLVAKIREVSAKYAKENNVAVAYNYSPPSNE